MGNESKKMSLPDRMDIYLEVIRHFRGFVNKERLPEDIAYLQNFLNRLGVSPRRSSDKNNVNG